MINRINDRVGCTCDDGDAIKDYFYLFTYFLIFRVLLRPRIRLFIKILIAEI